MTLPYPTRYLLRLDDACPTWNRARWMRVFAAADAAGIEPILGVLPDNRDPELNTGAADPEFWPMMRARAAGGATIALHGLHHLSASAGGGLLPLHHWTEFAGAPLDQQRHWIQRGLAILRAEGLEPKLWIAPRHGQDRNTLRALTESGLEILSDGFAPHPYRRGGVIWMPQQLWTPAERGPGLWTLLIHPNTASDQQLTSLEDFLWRKRDQFLSFPNALALFPPLPRYTARQWLSDELTIRRIRLQKMWQRWRSRSS